MTISHLVAGFLCFSILGAFGWGVGEIIGKFIEEVLK